MPKDFILLCAILLISTGMVFIFVGWFWFHFLRLNPIHATKATGTLVCFRQHLLISKFRNYVANDCFDYQNNRSEVVPVVRINIDDDLYDISAASPDYSLTRFDIGTPVRVCYQRKFGIVLLIDNEKSIRNYIRLKKTLFWCFLSVGMILAAIGVLLLLLY